ncbi:MAG: DUF3035 domain-containing protein [Pseudomonadota bacterium]|nr:DUF3035 domain-containing protein [Pseudomonadota bacterium]
MRKLVPIAAGVGFVLLLSGCGHRGYGKGGGPDEFAVGRQAPLVIPPDFSLTPPKPGAARSNDATSQAQALDALFGGRAQHSGAENAVLDSAGADNADPGIRSNVGDPATAVIDKGATTRDVIAAPEGDGQNARAATPQ